MKTWLSAHTVANLECVGAAVGRPAVDDIMKGFNASLFGYGQTGSGKTYTLLGDVDPSSPPEEEVTWCSPPTLCWEG